MSAKNAFNGHIPYSTPLRDDHQFRTPLYAKWLTKVKDSGSLAPTWEAFRDKALAGPAPKPKPINGLSQQARDQLAKAPKSIGIGRLTEANKRSKAKRAAI